MKYGWAAWWRRWVTWHQPVTRGRRIVPRIEPLEVRTMLAGEFTDLGALGIAGVEHAS